MIVYALERLESVMETFYLVDYENVGSGGVSKCSGLCKMDHLIIFYTENSKKIDLDIVNNHGEAIFETQKVPAKSQSVDMHIVSYMGYLVGKNEGKSIKIIIISKDKDYDNLIKFWSDKAVIERKQKIECSTKKKELTKSKDEVKKATTTTKSSQKNTTEVKTAAASKTAKTTEKKPKKSELKTQLNTEIQKTISKNDYPKEAINDIAKLVAKQYGKENFKQRVHNELRKDYPATYEEIYKAIKPILTKFS